MQRKEIDKRKTWTTGAFLTVRSTIVAEDSKLKHASLFNREEMLFTDSPAAHENGGGIGLGGVYSPAI